VRQPSLADAGLAEHGRQHGLAFPHRPRQPLSQLVQLLDPVDQRCVQADRQRPGADRRRQQPEPVATGRLNLQRPGGQRTGLVADENLTDCGLFGQLDRLADGVAGEA